MRNRWSNETKIWSAGAFFLFSLRVAARSVVRKEEGKRGKERQEKRTPFFLGEKNETRISLGGSTISNFTMGGVKRFRE